MINNDTVELSEYDNSDLISLSDNDIQMIESQVDGLQVEYRKNEKFTLHTDHRVGVVSLPDGPTIQIRPKIGEPNLVTLMRYANDIEPTHFSRETGLEQGTNFVDTIANLFLAELKEVLSQGLRREYVGVEGTEEFLRGRLNIRRQLAGGPAKTDFECDYDKFTYDTTLNQTILYVTNVLRSLVDSGEIAGELSGHESRLRRRITLREVPILEAEQIELTRLTDYYKKLLELSRLILNHVYIKDIVVGEGVSYSLLIGMNDLFEKLVERTVEETIEDQDELSFEAQATTDSLLKESQSISMQPDLLIKRNGEPVLVGDVKWKDEIKNDDVYQIVSYQTAYDVPSILVYPDNDGEVQNNYYVKNGKKLNILELQSGSNTTDVSEFGRNNVEEFSDALKEFGLMDD